MMMIRVWYGHTKEHTPISSISICWLHLQLAGISMHSHITHTASMPGVARWQLHQAAVQAFLPSPSLSLTYCVNRLHTMLYLIVAALTPQCQGISGFPRLARFGTLSHASQNVKSFLFELPTPLLTDLAHLLTATLSLSLHVARNDMRLPMLRTDWVAPSPFSSLSIRKHQPATRHNYGIAATIIYATRAAKKPQISQRLDAQHPQQLQQRAVQKLKLPVAPHWRLLLLLLLFPHVASWCRLAQ